MIDIKKRLEEIEKSNIHADIVEYECGSVGLVYPSKEMFCRGMVHYTKVLGLSNYVDNYWYNEGIKEGIKIERKRVKAKAKRLEAKTWEKR